MRQNMTMKDLPLSERPYEKCAQQGAHVLTDAELLAVIIRTGTKDSTAANLANEILAMHPVYKGIAGLNFLTHKELMKVNGVGPVKATQLLCIAELSKRIAKTVNKDNIRFDSPSSIADYFMEETRYLTREQMILLLFDTKNRLLKELIISIGTVNASLASTREIFVEALRYEAVYFILVHNHPSGDPTPSPQDIAVTKRIQQAGELIGINLEDHIILGEHRYISLRERGVI